MTNFFAILELPESLLIEPDSIETSWSEKTKESESGDLHEARRVLSDPASRLEHWLDLRGVEQKRGSTIDPGMMDLFSRLHEALAETDSVIAKLKKATTSLARAILTKDAISAQLGIQECLQQVQGEKAARVNRFPELESAATGHRFEEALLVLGQLKFLKKWEQQCQQRLLSLLEF